MRPKFRNREARDRHVGSSDNGWLWYNPFGRLRAALAMEIGSECWMDERYLVASKYVERF